MRLPLAAAADNSVHFSSSAYVIGKCLVESESLYACRPSCKRGWYYIIIILYGSINTSISSQRRRWRRIMSSDIKKYVATASCSDNDSPTAACDLGQFHGKPVQPKLQKYAPKKYGAKQRDFQSTWYSGRPWLEFSVALEAAFCYCCRHFSNRMDPHFTVTGFSNWQHALEKNKGFSKHAASIVHMQAMAAWKE